MRDMRIYKGLILLMLMACPLMGQAQLTMYDFYLDVTAGGGLHTIQYSPEGGDHTPGFGSELKLAYRRPINERWCVSGGLGFSWYNGRSFYEDLRLSRAAVDAQNGEPYEYRVIFTNWKEKQHIANLEIPLMASYHYPINPKWSHSAAAGLKLFFPISNNFKITDGTLQTKGYFEHLTNIEYENLPQHGFFTKDDCEGKATLRKVGAAAAVDLGAYRSFKHSDMSLYMGLYFGYGFTNLAKEHSTLFDGTDYVGVVSSDRIGKAHLISAGIKAGISFGFPRIYPLPDMQHELAMEDENFAFILAGEIEKFEDSEVEDVLRIARELAAAEEARKARELAEVKEVVKWLNKNVKVEFKLGEAVVQMNDEIQSYINDLTHYIKTTPGRNVIIWGHTCNLGTEAKNIELGMQRSEAMRKLLIQAGCPINRVMARSKGSSEPLVPNTCEANRRQNRRIEIVVK